MVQARWHTPELSTSVEAHCDDRRSRSRQAAAEKLTEDFGAYQRKLEIFGPSVVIACLHKTKRRQVKLERGYKSCGKAHCERESESEINALGESYGLSLIDKQCANGKADNCAAKRRRLPYHQAAVPKTYLTMRRTVQLHERK